MKRFFLLFCFVFLFCLSAGALRAEEERWYLISETELQIIEKYKERSEREKQSWLLQAQKLRQDSTNLNAQLAQAREQNRNLEKLFSEYEADRLIQLSLKNGEIDKIKSEKEKEIAVLKDRVSNRNKVIIGLGIGLVAAVSMIIIIWRIRK